DAEVPLGAPIIVQFSRSVAPLTTLAAQPTDQIVTFDPPLQGKGEWLNTSIYRFTPSDLRPTTTYRLTIPRGLTSAADGVLESNFVAKFTTVTPGVARIAPEDNTQFAAPLQKVVVTFNQPMDRSAASGITVQDEGGVHAPGSVSWSEDDTVASFTPSVRLRPGAMYVVMVERGLKGARGGEMAKARSSSFRVVPAPSVQSTMPRDGETAAGRFGVNIQFATPMAPESLEGKLSISGLGAADLEGHVTTSETGIHAGVTLRPSTRYTARLAAGATDRYGQALGAHAFSFTTGELPATVTLALPGQMPAATVSASVEPLLYFQATNTPTVSFTLWRLTSDEGRGMLHDFGRASSTGYTPSGAPLRTWSETIEAKKDETYFGATSLSGGGPLPKGYYFARTSGQLQSMFAFAVVDAVLVTKVANDELLAWVVDHDTGRPVADVNVRVSGPGAAPTERRTDGNGLASFSVPAPTLGSNLDRSYVLWIEEGSRSAVTSTRWSQGTSPFQFGLLSEYYQREWVGQIYTDRPIYRPGETVEYKGIVRADDDARYSLPPQETPLRFVLRNARGQEVLSSAVRVNGFGSFGGSFALAADSPLGDYAMTIEKPSGTGGYHIASNSFLVAEFRKPEFQVDVAPAKTSYTDGESISVRTDASFFFGGAVAGAPVAWSVTSEPFAPQVKGYERYSFVDFDWARQSVTRQGVRASGTATTAADGSATFAVPASLASAEGAQRFTLGVTVTDLNAQAVSGSGSVTVHPAAGYAGVRP
ncbi:MAG TPA: Ig-like domain-containing protein, partial [Candidatus Limnocylindria bacterium]|nr:Ig-like domain-containing protein [Candidatus Limnocylindria bacterium]